MGFYSSLPQMWNYRYSKLFWPHAQDRPDAVLKVTVFLYRKCQKLKGWNPIPSKVTGKTPTDEDKISEAQKTIVWLTVEAEASSSCSSHPKLSNNAFAQQILAGINAFCRLCIWECVRRPHFYHLWFAKRPCL